ncbi:MAG: Histidine kinase protein [Deltaproteobacteria bacterium]|nr:Histidine kinase protein [Deltaproteobacteria bacterium]
MGHQSQHRGLLFFISAILVLVLLGQTVVLSRRWLNEAFPGFFVHQNLTVGPYSVPGWGGTAAGLQSLDRIVSIDGRDLNNRAELYDRVRSLAAGSNVRYRVMRDTDILDLTIPSKIFGLRDWLLSFGVYGAIGLAFLVIGVMPYFYRASSPVALPLCFMVMAVFVWFQTTFDFMTDGWLPKEIRIFALCLTPSAAIHLALMLSRRDRPSTLQRLSVLSIYGIGVAIAMLNSLSYFGAVETWRLIFRAAYGYVFVGAVIFLAITGRALRSTESDLERSRLRVMFVGALAGFVIPALTAVLTSSLQLPIPYNLALLPTVFFPLSVAYALLKYSLFDLGRVFKIALSRVALLVVLLAIYAAVAFLVAPWAAENAKDPLVLMFFSVLVVVLFNPVLRWLERVIDRHLYQQDYDPAQVQAKVSLFLRTLAGAPALAKGFIEQIVGPLNIDRAALFYRAKDADQWLTASTDSPADNFPASPVDERECLTLWHGNNWRAICRDEVSTDPQLSDRRERVLHVFARLGAELLLPLVYEREVRGIISFSAKRSGREYSAGDYRLLGTLTEQLTLSLENGRLYEESLQAYRRVEDVNRKLIESDRVKKDFVANICHELRTPITTIIGFGEVLRDFNIPSDARMILDKLVSNGQELSSLMDNLMNYARMEAKGCGAEAQFEIVKLKEILGALEMMTQRLIRARPIEFGVHNESAIDTIESDGQKLQQILAQLLTNALKFTEKGRIDLSIREHRERGALEIAVADTGIGIRREDQELIFEDFASALGGEIQVASEVGVGSVFKLLLPVKAAAPRYAA